MYDLVVIGGGAGGLNVATAAARVGAKVALIEKNRLGGECTHTACVPSKALIRAAKLVHEIRHAGRYGIDVADPEVDFPAVMARVRRVVGEFAGSDSGDSLRARGIDVYRGAPAFEAYDTVLVDGLERVSGRRFVIATGSRPAVPPVPGLAEAGYLDNTTIWGLTELPAQLLILGGGVVGIEFAQAFARLGTSVTVLETGPRILRREDPEVSDRVRTILAGEGVSFFTNLEVIAVSRRDDGQAVVKFRSRDDGQTYEAARAHLMVAAGRWANVEGLNLRAAGLEADPEHGIEVDEYLQTRTRHILAIGDVIGHHQWTHAAEREAAVAFQNAVIGLPKKIDYSVIPRATYTDPEVATVGRLGTIERPGGLPQQTLTFRAEFEDLDRARIDGQTQGFAKVVATPSGKILGATVVGTGASTILQEFVLAMEHGLTLGDIAATVHPYPSYGGMARKIANQYMASRLGGGFVQTALRWFYGWTPRAEAAQPAPAPAGAEPEPVSAANGQGHA